MPKRTNDPSDPKLTILLFGRPQLLLAGRPLDALRRKNRALLYYLAAHTQPLARDHILNLFWPDHDRAAAQQVLRTMLYDLRKHLGTAVKIENETLALAPDAEIDARRFEAGVSARSANASTLSALLELYRGDLLEGFALPDAAQFDDWAHSERERYRLLAVRALTTLSQLLESQRDWTAALVALNRALGFDPLQEELQRNALRLQYLAGDRPGAIRRYESLRKLLDDEMGVPPMPETRALYDAIITDSLSKESMPAASIATVAAPRPTPPTPGFKFVGREQELKAMAQAASIGKMILIEGEPGIGKTRLAQEFIALHAGALVLNGAAHELEEGLPYQPIVEALRGLGSLPEWTSYRAQVAISPVWQAGLARLVPELLPESAAPSSSATTIDESRMWEALDRFLFDLARHRPVILFLDDLHWADSATLAWLGYLMRHPTPPSFLLVATTRTIEPRAKLTVLQQTLLRQERMLRLKIEPLQTADLRSLAEQIRPTHAEALTDWLARYTEGNPFFATELLRFAAANGLLESETLERDGLTAPTIPESIQNLIAARLTRLTPNARRVLDTAAVVGREFDADLVMRVSGLTDDAVLDAIDELCAATLIRQREAGQFAFGHSLTMQTVMQEMVQVRQFALHRRIAQVLEKIHQGRLEPLAGLIARHWAEAQAPAQVAPYAFQAGQFAASLAAWAEAIAFYEQALATETDDARRASICLALGAAHFNRGDFAQASQLLYSAVALAETSRDLERLEEAHLALNQSFYPQSRYREAIELAERLARSGPVELALCAEFTWGTAIGLESKRPVEAELHLRRAEELIDAPRSFESRVTPAKLKYQMAGVAGQQGRFAEAIALYRQALELVRADESALDLQRHILLFNNLAYYLHLQRDPAGAEYARTGLQFAREKGTLTHQSYLLSTSGEIALAQDDLDGAQTFFDEGLELAERLNIPERVAGLTANLGLIANRRGDREGAQRLLNDALSRADQIGSGHLSARIRIWLVPLLPTDRSRQRLREAREIAEAGHYAALLEEIDQLERKPPLTPV